MTSPTPPPPLASLRSRIRRLIWWSGLGTCVTVLCAALFLAGSVDWWLRIDDLGLRVLLAVTVWSAVAATIWRTLGNPLVTPLTDLFLAEQIERRYPGFSGRISSATAFRAAGCLPQHGSPDLQRLLIAQADDELRHVDPELIVTAQPVRRAALACVVSCLLAALLLLAFPLEAATAVRRLAWPWGDTPWPQRTVLQLLTRDGKPVNWPAESPRQIVRGDTLELLVENARGRLPEQVWLETRWAADAVPTRDALRRLPSTEAAKPTAERAQLALAAVRGPLEFRVIGGDDRSMPWRTVEVVDPPTLASYDITITPPPYTRQSPQVLPVGATQIRGWLGSQVTIDATATRPLGSAALLGRDRPPQPLELTADRMSFRAEITLEKPESTAVWFQLRDPAGLTEREPLQFELRGDIDALPQVSLPEPAADLVVTPDAEVPLVIDARDDLGVNSLRLTWQRGEQPVETKPLFDYAEPRPETVERSRWQLSDLALVPGDRIVFRVEAGDACDVGPPHVGKTGPRTLLVASASEKRAELQARASELVEDLRDAADLQTRLRDQTAEVQTELQTTGTLRPQDRDVLHRVELDQRGLSTRLSGSATSLADRAEQLQGEFQFNQLTDPDTELGLEQLAKSLRELSQTSTQQATRELTQAAKLLADAPEKDDTTPETAPKEPPTAETTAAAESLAQAARHQADVLDTLTDLQSTFAEWRGQRDIGRELSSLVEEQAAVANSTAELGGQTVAKSEAELSPQQRAELAKLAARQRRQAERIEQLQQHLEQMEQAADEPNSTANEAAGDAAERLADAETAARARQAANDIGAYRLGPATEQQRAVQDALRALQQEWDAQEPDDAEQLVKRLQELEQQAQQLAADQEQLRKRTAENTPPQPGEPSPAEQATELRRRAQRLERQLQRLRLNRSAETARRAAEHLRNAEELSSDDEGESRQQEQQQAAEELAQLQQELSQERQSAEERLAQEAIERIAQSLESLKQRQAGVVAETERLEQERQARGQWTRGQLRSLNDLADVERELVAEADQLMKQLENATIPRAALQRVVRSLTAAAERLAERQTDALTQRWERDAVRRLEQLLSAWNRRPDPTDPAQPNEQPPGDQPAEQSGGPPGEAVSLQVQLQLLRDWQADCLARTTEWNTLHPEATTLSESERTELAALADEQGELAKLARELIDTLQSSRPQPAAKPTEAQ
jgi:hypothetical protein